MTEHAHHVHIPIARSPATHQLLRLAVEARSFGTADRGFAIGSYRCQCKFHAR